MFLNLIKKQQNDITIFEYMIAKLYETRKCIYKFCDLNQI